MSPEAVRFLAYAEACLRRADTMLIVELCEDTGRAAYLACFHAAQAYIFEKTGKSSKSHHGVQTEFFRLTKDENKVDPILRRFLSQAYEFKAVADYFVGDDAGISREQAVNALATARQFVANMASLLDDRGSDPA